MKKLRIAVIAIVAVLILAVVAVWVLANPNSHRETIQAELEKQLGRKVSLGDMSLGFLPLRFQVANPVIAEDPRIRQEPAFVKADNLDIRIGLLPLLRGAIQVDSLDLRRPSIELVATKDGKWNFSTIGAESAAKPGAPAASSGGPGEFTLQRLTITDGQIGVTDLRRGPQRTGYDHIDLTVEDFSAHKPFSFDLAAHVQGQTAQELRLKGTGGPIAQAAADTPFHGTLSLKQIEIDGLLKFLDSTAVPKSKGTLSGESEVTSQAGNITSNGKLKLEGAKVNNVDIGYPIGFDYQLADRVSDGLVTINNATLQLGPTPLSVTGMIKTEDTPPQIDLNIKSGDASIAEIARLASAFGVAFAPGTTVAGRVSANVHAKGSTDKPVLTGTIAGRDLQISGQSVPQPVQVKAIDLALSPTAIQSNEFNATTGKTTVTGKFSLLQYASNSPSIDLGLKTAGATLPEIQSIAKAYGVTGLDQINGAGTLNFDMNAKGALRTLSTTEAMRALNGTINLDFSPLKVAGFDTMHELATLGGFGSGMTEQNATNIVRVIGQIIVKNGIAQTDGLKAQVAAGNLTASGNADLAAESLNLKLAAIFAKEFSDKVGATRAGGVMNTAFTNSNGEIVLPAIVTGTFNKPKFAPDLKAVVDLQKQKYLSKEGALDTVSKALGAFGKKTDTPDQPADKKPSGLKGLLDVLGNKK
jgi:AsmA protein